MTAPGWFVDPSGQHALRYWDGSGWTAHVAVPSPVPPPPRRPDQERPVRTRRVAGWVGLLLCVVSAIAIATQVRVIDRAADGPRSGVDSDPRRVSLAPGTTYEIVVDDTDQDGYSLGCTVEDFAGRPVALRHPSWYTTDSDTETVEYLFDTGNGNVVISCDSSGDPVEVRPHMSYGPVLAIGAASTVAGTIGLTLLVLWLVSWLQVRSARRTSNDVTA